MQPFREVEEFIPPNKVITQQWLTSEIKTQNNGQALLIHLPPDPTVAIILLQLRLRDPSFDMTLYDTMLIAEQSLSLREGSFAILDDSIIRDYVVASKYKIQIHLVLADTQRDDAGEGGISGLV